MPDKLNQFFQSLNSKSDHSLDKLKENSGGGVSRTAGDSGKSPQSVGPQIPIGFTPNNFYGDSWTGDTISHEVSNEQDPNSPGKPTTSSIPGPNGISTDTNSRFNLNSGWTEANGPIPTRKVYQMFEDTSTDFFKHGLHIDGRTSIKTDKNTLHTSDGSNASPQDPHRLGAFVETPYENTDPVMFGFEIVMHGSTSPLFNGGVEDFIQKFGFGVGAGGVTLKEVASRKDIISNFKQQFFKFFKSDSPITSTGTDIPADRFYLGYYLKKVSGLENLSESNTSEKSKSFVDYKKDVIKLSFTEDVSLSIGSMAYLYKLLYWSRINGKNIIPQNLLRFDCDIIITEIRNFTRVKKSMSGANGVDILKDNLSRYVYSLYECQMFFDKMPHESEIDIGSPAKSYDSYDMTFNYKFASMRFEKWVPKFTSDNAGSANSKPDNKYSGGGQYSTLNNDRVDPFGIKTNETTNVDTGNNSITPIASQPKPAYLQSFHLSDDTSSGGSDAQNPISLGKPTPKLPTSMDNFKSSSKKAAKNLAKNLQKAVVRQVNTLINTRARLLNNSIDKIRNSLGVGRMSFPTNIYNPPATNGVLNPRFFYDVQNGLRDFLGESLGGALNSFKK